MKVGETELHKAKLWAKKVSLAPSNNLFFFTVQISVLDDTRIFQ